MAKALCLRLDVQSNPLRPWLLMFQVIIRLGKMGIKSNMRFQCGGIHFSVYIVMISCPLFGSTPPASVHPLQIWKRTVEGQNWFQPLTLGIWHPTITTINTNYAFVDSSGLNTAFFFLVNSVNLTPNCTLICAPICAAFYSNETATERISHIFTILSKAMFWLQINNAKLLKKPKLQLYSLVLAVKCMQMFCATQIGLLSVLYSGRLFGNSGACSACGQSIPASELVMRAQGNVYHLKVKESGVKRWTEF